MPRLPVTLLNYIAEHRAKCGAHCGHTAIWLSTGFTAEILSKASASGFQPGHFTFITGGPTVVGMSDNLTDANGNNIGRYRVISVYPPGAKIAGEPLYVVAIDEAAARDLYLISDK